MKTTKIRFPGENVVQTRKRNEEKGIPVNSDVWGQIIRL